MKPPQSAPLLVQDVIKPVGAPKQEDTTSPTRPDLDTDDIAKAQNFIKGTMESKGSSASSSSSTQSPIKEVGINAQNKDGNISVHIGKQD
jgi:hypothetical protein